MKRLIFTTTMFGLILYCQAQTKIGGSGIATKADALVEMGDDVGNKKGLVIPRVPLTATNSALPMTSHIAGMTVYNTATSGTFPYNVVPGFYYNDGLKWVLANPSDVPNATTAATGKVQLAGDLAGTGTTALVPKVSGLQGTPVSGTAPVNGQILSYNGTSWSPITPSVFSEADGVVGNEVADVLANGGLTRSGSGTNADPYKIGMTSGTASGQVMQWNGTGWSASDIPNATTAATGKVQLAGDLAGSGTTALVPKVSGLQGTPVSGTAPVNGQILSFNGTSWSPITPSAFSEADGIVGNEVADVLANGGLTRSGSGTNADPYKIGMTSGTASGQVMQWNGTGWSASDIPNATTAATGKVQLAGDLAGSGTTALVPKVSGLQGTPVSGTAPVNGQILSFNGTSWSPITPSAFSEADGIVGNEVADVLANGGLTRSGSGTNADPYKIGITSGTASGQVMQWNGTGWSASDIPNATTAATGKVQLAGDLAGSGTTALVPKVSGLQGTPVSGTAPVNGQILSFNGTSWSPITPSAFSEADGVVGNEVTDVLANRGLTRSGTGTNADPFKIGMTSGTVSGQVMQWNGTGWVLSTPSNGTVTSVTGTLPIAVASGTTAPVISLNSLGVSNGFLAANAVTTDKILDGTIVNADLAAGTGGIYKGSGSLSGPTVVTGGANSFAFTSTSTATNAFSVDGTTFSLDAQNNRVGMGTASPTTTLHLFSGTSGALRIEDGTQSIGKVLTSDANGVATWAASGVNTFTGVVPSVYSPFGTAPGVTYLNAYIDLPIGKFFIYTGVLVNGNNQPNTNYAARLSYSSASNSYSTSGFSYIGSFLMLNLSSNGAGAITSSSIMFASGFVKVNITTPTRLYLMDVDSVGFGNVGHLEDSGENYIFAIQANN
ncbi:beta strand repeat-containing protein [Flavobacterium humidisoli]|uniref:C1q domain-containing protein n=1 Tax=Flavobacterium humidisoli TaxID=2937442 RepID=A0ABY4LXS1_9FLAO|nr:hypothetical protein [Flavobacterium humidisoli]UPZ17873.1 hypothetical protein M0M44_11105 [Flavobacterium humidisoli]